MPDILIRGMEYPKSCSRCDFASVVPGEAWCKRAKEIVPEEQAINVNMHPTFCPLHELQEHGDLIEAEPIKRFITDGLNRKEFGYDQIQVLTEVEYAPVIVPASEEATNDPKT